MISIHHQFDGKPVEGRGKSLVAGKRIVRDAEKKQYQKNYLLGAPPLRIGQNFLELALDSTAASPLQVQDIKLSVKYKGGKEGGR